MLKCLAIFAMLVFGFVDLAWSQIPRDGSQQQKHTQEQQNNSNALQPSTLGLQVQNITPKHEQGSEQKPSEYAWRELYAPANVPNWVLAFLAGLAGCLAYKTLKAIKKQADIMERQTILTEQTLVLTQRPRITVKAIYFKRDKGVGGLSDPPSGIDPQSFCAVQFYAENCGGTQARLLEIWCQPYIAEKLPMERPYEGEIGAKQDEVLSAGESTPRTFFRNTPLDDQTSSDLRNGHRNLYILGWIGYIDGFNIYRRTHFCRRLDVGKDRFVIEQDLDYESAD
jgi:hypothetical protein